MQRNKYAFLSNPPSVSEGEVARHQSGCYQPGRPKIWQGGRSVMPRALVEKHLTTSFGTLAYRPDRSQFFPLNCVQWSCDSDPVYMRGLSLESTAEDRHQVYQYRDAMIDASYSPEVREERRGKLIKVLVKRSSEQIRDILDVVDGKYTDLLNSIVWDSRKEYIFNLESAQSLTQLLAGSEYKSIEASLMKRAQLAFYKLIWSEYYLNESERLSREMWHFDFASEVVGCISGLELKELTRENLVFLAEMCLFKADAVFKRYKSEQGVLAGQAQSGIEDAKEVLDLVYELIVCDAEVGELVEDQVSLKQNSPVCWKQRLEERDIKKGAICSLPD